MKKLILATLTTLSFYSFDATAVGDSKKEPPKTPTIIDTVISIITGTNAEDGKK